MSNRRSKARRTDDAAGMSLFPFLAVLICTVGALILLLVVLGRQARVQAAQMAQAQKTQIRKDIKEKLEDVDWHIEKLQESYEATRKQLVEKRLEVGHLEDHARELRGKLESLQRAWDKLLDKPTDAQNGSAEEGDLQRLSAEIDQLREKVKEARGKALTGQPSYAIVPYEGPYGTRRRPIYLECRADSVVLQPEGVVFEKTDFTGPLGPGNPLAAALRAAREYLLRAGQFDPSKAGEPYPLLLIRPNGIYSYYAAREAMSSWEDDFGYVMVDADWKLDYENPDPQMAEVVRQEIERARTRMARIAQAAPSYYRHLQSGSPGERPQYTVSQGTGVVVPYGGTGGGLSTVPRGRGRGTGYGDRDSDPTSSAGRGNSAIGNNGPGTGNGQGNGFGEGTGTGNGYGNGTGTGNGYGVANGTGNQAGMGSGTGNGTGTGDGTGTAYGDGTGIGTGDGTGDGTGIGTGTGGNGYAFGDGANGGSGMNSGTGGYGQSGTGPGNSMGSSDPTGGKSLMNGENAMGNSPTGSSTGGSGGQYPGGATNGQNGNGSGNPAGSMAGNMSASGGSGSAGGAASGGAGGLTIGSMGGSSSGGSCPLNLGMGGGASGGQADGSQSGGGLVSLSGPQMGGGSNGTSSNSASGGASPTSGSPCGPGQYCPTSGDPSGSRGAASSNRSQPSRKPQKSLADKRGRDWALPEASSNATPLSQPVRIECYRDRMVLVPQRGLSGGRTVALGPQTRDSVDELIAGVWNYVEGWGMAGRGMYWRPVLHVYVAPGAENRYQDVAELLRGSGLPVERKK